MADANAIRHKNKRFQFYFHDDTGYRQNVPEAVSFDRSQQDRVLKAPFRCFEDYRRANSIVLRFKVEPVARSETFEVHLNGRHIAPGEQTVLYASNGRDTRIHPVTLGPYFEYEIPLKAEQLGKGDNELEVKPARLVQDTTGTVRLVELELRIQYDG
jgi:hypothetical protein